jgi:hypothetical protein
MTASLTATPADSAQQPARGLMPHAALRAKLLETFLDACLPTELAAWLRRIGLPSHGTAAERKARLRAQADYLRVPVTEFPRETRREFDRLTTPRLVGLCRTLGLPITGSRESLYRRALREVGYAEGWLPREARLVGDTVDRADVEPFVRWHPVLSPVSVTEELAADLADELSEVFGADRVHKDIPVDDSIRAPTIDVHIGDDVVGGVGIAVAARESGIPRARLARYRARYGTDLIVLLYPTRALDGNSARTADDLRTAGVESVITIE